MKRVKIIVFDDEKNRRVEIPLTKRQCHDFLDFGYIMSGDEEEEYYSTLKLNKCDKSFWEFHKMMGKVCDAQYDGKCFKFEGNKLVESKHKYYLQGRPRWIKGGLK